MKGNLVIHISPEKFDLVFSLSKIPIASTTKNYKNTNKLKNILSIFLQSNKINPKEIINVVLVTDFTSFMKDIKECSFGYIQIGDIQDTSHKTKKYLDGIKLNIHDYNITSLNTQNHKTQLFKFLEHLQCNNINKIALNSFFSSLNSDREKEIIRNIREIFDDTLVICPSYTYNISNYLQKESIMFLDLYLFEITKEIMANIDKALTQLNINACIYFLKGNGTLTSQRIASTSPTVTWQSFFTSQLIGASIVCREKNAFVLTKNNYDSRIGIVQNNQPKLTETFSFFKGLHLPDFFPQFTSFSTILSNDKLNKILGYNTVFSGPVPIINLTNNLKPVPFYTHPVINLENHPSIMAQGALNAPFQLELSSIISSSNNKIISVEKEKLINESRKIIEKDNIKLKSISYIFEITPIKYIQNNVSYMKLHVNGTIL